MSKRSTRAKLIGAGTALALAVAASIAITSGGGGEAEGVESPVTNGRNVVVILTDDQVVDELEAMEFTDGRDDWVRFDQATVQNPVCCPSRATILSGRYDVSTGVKTNGGGAKFDDRTSFATWFDHAGYETGLFGKYLNDYPFAGSELIPRGWDKWVSFLHDDRPGSFYVRYTLIDDERPVIFSDDKGDYSTDVLADKVVEFIEGNADQPFLAYYAPRAPHPPSIPARRHLDAPTPDFEPKPSFNEADISDKPRWMQDLKPRNRSRMIELTRRREQTLLAVDEGIEKIFDALERTGVLEETYVVFLSDNGFMLGEHRLTRKACPYEECIRIPMMIRGPDLEPGTITDQVSNVDLAPTLAELVGIAPPRPRKLDGISLAPLLLEGEPLGDREMLLHSKPPLDLAPQWWGVRTERYKLIRTRGTNEIELYDLHEDPYELENLATDPGYADIVERLRLTLRKLRPNGR